MGDGGLSSRKRLRHGVVLSTLGCLGVGVGCNQILGNEADAFVLSDSHSGGAASGGASSGGASGGTASRGGSGGQGDTGGSAPTEICTAGTRSCAGNTPRLCDDAGTWQLQAECSAPTPACVGAGKCVACTNGARRCVGKQPQECVDNEWQLAGPECNDTKSCAEACGIPLVMSQGRIRVPALEIDGPVFSFTDAGGVSAITPTQFGTLSGDLCVSGETAMAPPDCQGSCWDDNWGVALSINLRDSQGMPAPYDADMHGVVGFYFEVDGPDIPERMRFTLSEPYTTVCVNATPGSQAVYLEDMRDECWSPEPGDPPAAGMRRFEGIRWTVYAIEEETTPFDLCVKNVYALLDRYD